MNGKKNAKENERPTGGQAGSRGYLVQTLIGLLDGALARPPFTSFTLEPGHDAEQFDLVLEDAKGCHAVQIKSTSGQFKRADVYDWAKKLEASGSAVEYRLCLVGLYPANLAKVSRVGRVVIDKKNLDLPAFFEQAALRLEIFLRSEDLEPGTAEERLMLAKALTAQLATYSTTGKPLTRDDLGKLLRTWVIQTPRKGPLISVTRLRHGAEKLVGREKELDNLDKAWDDPKTHVVTIVAWGGVGKTALVVDWMARMAGEGWRGAARVFDWSFYSQGASETTATAASHPAPRSRELARSARSSPSAP